MTSAYLGGLNDIILPGWSQRLLSAQWCCRGWRSWVSSPPCQSTWEFSDPEPATPSHQRAVWSVFQTFIKLQNLHAATARSLSFRTSAVAKDIWNHPHIILPTYALHKFNILYWIFLSKLVTSFLPTQCIRYPIIWTPLDCRHVIPAKQMHSDVTGWRIMSVINCSAVRSWFIDLIIYFNPLAPFSLKSGPVWFLPVWYCHTYWVCLYVIVKFLSSFFLFVYFVYDFI